MAVGGAVLIFMEVGHGKILKDQLFPGALDDEVMDAVGAEGQQCGDIGVGIDLLAVDLQDDVPQLQALGMVEGAVALVPAAKVGHIGICRDENSKDGDVSVYYSKLPFDINERDVIIMDLMLGTGATALKAIEKVKEAGAHSIKLMTVITCPEGVEAVQEKYPDVDIYCGALDERLNEDLYIVPGFGDGGDRIFGTK